MRIRCLQWIRCLRLWVQVVVLCTLRIVLAPTCKLSNAAAGAAALTPHVLALAQVLAEEEKNRAQLAAKEQQYATLVQQMQAVLDKALALAPELGGALEAMAVCHGGGEGDGVLCERVERVLDALAKRLGDDAAELEQYKSTIKNREFENDLLKKQLQLRNPTKTPAKHLLPAAAPGGEENVHPNSPLCVSDKTPGKVGPAGTKAVGGRRSVLGQIADQ
jgi:hypothetical protein